MNQEKPTQEMKLSSTEDSDDLAIAIARLKAINDGSERLIRGEELAKRLTSLEEGNPVRQLCALVSLPGFTSVPMRQPSTTKQDRRKLCRLVME